MSSTSRLEREADRSLSEFKAQISQSKQKLRPSSVIDSALRKLDPDYAILNRLKKRVTKNPFALLAAISGLALLVRQVTEHPISAQTEKPTQRNGRVGVTPKGDHHGQHFISK